MVHYPSTPILPVYIPPRPRRWSTTIISSDHNPSCSTLLLLRLHPDGFILRGSHLLQCYRKDTHLSSTV